jgi:Polyketide cyclase / dehydrase and lipid transport
MDCYATLASPVQAVFAHLASPARPGDWLPEVAAGPEAPALPGELGGLFPLTVRAHAGPVNATGEVTAFEPPWLVGYRLSAGHRTLWLRVTCTAADEGTRIHLHQSGDAPLAVSLNGLQQALAASAFPAPGHGPAPAAAGGPDHSQASPADLQPRPRQPDRRGGGG